MSFSNLQLIEPLVRALQMEKYVSPTPIQQQAIPNILNKRDLLGCAQTGTGKTAAFVVPLLQLMHQQRATTGVKHVQTLILVPTRELALQVGESIHAYGRYLDFNYTVIYGGVNQFNQVRSIRKGVDIVVATPGRLIDLLRQRHLTLSSVKYFVLDEADRMLDMGFVNDINRIIKLLPSKRQTLFFSATMPPSIKQLANAMLSNPVEVQANPVSSSVDKIDQLVYFTEKQNKQNLLVHLLRSTDIQSVLVFTEMKHVADKLARALNQSGIRTDALHGNKSQNQRQAALSNFKSGRIRVLVATDIAARGIDIDELGHVINFQLPKMPETYVHRIGRTGRAGAVGTAISLCDWSEKVLLSGIQKLIKKDIQAVKGHPFDISAMHSTPADAKRMQSTSSAGSFGRRKKQSRSFLQQM